MTKDSSINFTNSSFMGNIVAGKVSGNVEANINNEGNFSNELTDLLDLINQLDSRQFESATALEIETNTTTLKEAAEANTSRSPKVKAALTAIRSVLSNTAGSTAATGVVAAINRLLAQF